MSKENSTWLIDWVPTTDLRHSRGGRILWKLGPKHTQPNVAQATQDAL